MYSANEYYDYGTLNVDRIIQNLEDSILHGPRFWLWNILYKITFLDAIINGDNTKHHVVLRNTLSTSRLCDDGGGMLVEGSKLT